MRYWYESEGGEWFVRNGDVFDRFAEDYVNSPTMTAEKMEERIDLYINRRYDDRIS